jgi:hypothetical protein
MEGVTATQWQRNVDGDGRRDRRRNGNGDGRCDGVTVTAAMVSTMSMVAMVVTTMMATVDATE